MFSVTKKEYVRPSMKIKAMDAESILAASGDTTAGWTIGETTTIGGNVTEPVGPEVPALSKGTSQSLWSE